MKNKNALFLATLLYACMSVSAVYAESDDSKMDEMLALLKKKEEKLETQIYSLLSTAFIVMGTMLFQKYYAPIIERLMLESKYTFYYPHEIDTTLSSLVCDAKVMSEVENITSVLKNKRPAKHFIFSGPSGNGKKLLVHAMAKDADAPLIEINGEDLLDDIGSVQGRAQVEQMFLLAKWLVFNYGKCIIFIDDIEKIVEKNNEFSRREFRESTLFKLLASIDACSKNKSSILVIGGTSSACDKNDSKIFTLGRFSKIIEVKNPDAICREGLIHSAFSRGNVGLLADKEKIVKMVAGMSCAEIVTVLYDAQTLARTESKDDISLDHIIKSIDVIRLHKKLAVNGSHATLYMPYEIKETFSSVAGAQEAKEEFQDLVDYLRDHKAYEEGGVVCRKGILLTGTPGNGKTLLARALAGEAGLPFLVISGSAFSFEYVGQGQKAVARLFEQARDLAGLYDGCILFIDEIDAVGAKRRTSGTGESSEKANILNKLLTEMDGFAKEKNPIVIIGATNRPEMLDDALLRPGRFDRIINVRNPKMKEREEILKIHSAQVKVDSSVDLKKIAKATVGFSGAKLANLINEAALGAYKLKQKFVMMHDLEEAIDTLRLGKKSNIVMSEQEKKVTAFHEAGHALVTLLMPEHSTPLYKVTIVPRGGALGLTYSLPFSDQYSRIKEEMIAYVMHCLGGRIAEEIIFKKIGVGAQSDFEHASADVRSMVCSYGMSEKIGHVVYSQEYGQFKYSEDAARRIDEEVTSIMNQCYADTKKLLLANKDKLEKLANALLEKETMHASEIYELLGIAPRVEPETLA